jgi:SAM-dependent methyltransferase
MHATQSLGEDISSLQTEFVHAYESDEAPWEIGKPQAPFLAIANLVKGPILDAGCGTGNTSLFFAAQGHHVTGIDFAATAIERAQAKAERRGVRAEFLVKDALQLVGWNRRFCTILDSGLFHLYSGHEQRRYVEGIGYVIRPGGRLYLLAFSDDEPQPVRGLSRGEIFEAFSFGWKVESIEAVRGEINETFRSRHPDVFPPEGPKMWFSVIRKID